MPFAGNRSKPLAIINIKRSEVASVQVMNRCVIFRIIGTVMRLNYMSEIIVITP